jgi:hypothetical protein
VYADASGAVDIMLMYISCRCLSSCDFPQIALQTQHPPIIAAKMPIIVDGSGIMTRFEDLSFLKFLEVSLV